jgi:hypothetical protein
MVLPKRYHAAQQIWTPQNGTIRNGRASDHNVASATRRILVTAVVEFFCRQSITACFDVNLCIDFFKFIPIFCRRQVDFQNAGIRRDAQRMQSGVSSRSIALHPDRHLQIPACVLDSGNQIEVIRKDRSIRQEHMKAAIACLHTQRWPDQFGHFISCPQDSWQRVGHRI